MAAAASQALAGKPKQEQQRSELTRPTSLPAYRYVYGTCWAPGTPVGWQVVGNILYICHLLNSRPSSLTTHSVLFDKRSVSISGDPFDFAGAGASATNDVFSGHVRGWIGRGDQTSAPAQVVAEASDFAATDAWRGCTVLWAPVPRSRRRRAPLPYTEVPRLTIKRRPASDSSKLSVSAWAWQRR